MVEIKLSKDTIPIVRKTEPQIIQDYDKIRNEVEESFADSVILLTVDLQKNIDFDNSFDRKNLSKANKKIPWTKYQSKLKRNIKSYTDIVTDKVLDYEETYGFDRTIKNNVKNWINTNARTEALDISEKSKSAFNENYRGYFKKAEEEYPQVSIIKKSIGLSPKYTKAVNNYLVNQRDESTFQKARGKAKDYIRKLRRRRAELIAQTELWETIMKTRVLLHDHLFRQGELDMREIGKQWVAREDSCETCRRLDGEVRQWNESFAGKIKFPIAHPKCTCSYRLVKL